MVGNTPASELIFTSTTCSLGYTSPLTRYCRSAPIPSPTEQIDGVPTADVAAARSSICLYGKPVLRGPSTSSAYSHK